MRVVLSLTPSLAEAWRVGDAAAGHEVLPELVSRLSVFTVEVPPLRDRVGDVRLLAEHFLRKYAQRNPRAATSLSAEAVAKLEAYGWPGNVRELENVIERAAILSRSDVIQPEHLAFATSTPRSTTAPISAPRPPPASQGPAVAAPGPVTIGEPGVAPVSSKIDLDSQLEDIERRELVLALQRCGGNKAEVARSLGMQRTTLYYRLKRLGIDS